MLVEDHIISELIMSISKHYADTVATRCLRPLFAAILSDIDIARHISDLTEHADDFIIQGFHLDELYEDIIALSRFIFLVRRDILPHLRTLAEENIRMDSIDRVYRNMAFHALPTNITILAELLYSLYERAIAYDKKQSRKKGKKPIAHRFSELENVKKLIEKY
ncbi:hypothetical protein FUT83_11325 [Treponema phagedenis]|uniref:Uncharacterized protein n=2 Tax=Treponema phagedenis TaxID=162 RepID=A0AAE6IV66_TREPH|nr:hypothetical protein FUT82_13035 [Treponema phagedenis]QEK04332.1 hypothetical protein FUT83_11325 [Treponema phagedenis]QEK09986.1 hypothetical protein FUT81_11455 [Treponema phagedenis]